MLVKAKVNLSNLLDQVMPQIQTLIRSDYNHKLTDFVARYWHYRRIIDMGEKRFTSDYCKWTKKQGYFFPKRLAKEIFALAQNGIPVLSRSSVTKVVVTEVVRVIHQIEATHDMTLF